MALQQESKGKFESLGFSVEYTGAGLLRAAQKTTEYILTKKPKLILNLGTVGSFHYPIGKVVQVQSVVYRGESEKKLYSSIDLTLVPGISFPKVICGSGDFIEKKTDPLKQYPFDVMDMELYSLAHVAKKLNVPLVSIKVVSDGSSENTIQEWQANLEFARQCLYDKIKAL